MITLVGLGPGRRDSLTLGAYEALKSASTLFLRTERHPVVDDLRAEGISFTRPRLALRAVRQLRRGLRSTWRRRCWMPRAGATSSTPFPGIPCSASRASNWWSAARGSKASRSVLLRPAALSTRRWPRSRSASPAPAPGISRFSTPRTSISAQPDASLPALLYQVYDADTASRLKIALLEEYPDSHIGAR